MAAKKKLEKDMAAQQKKVKKSSSRKVNKKEKRQKKTKTSTRRTVKEKCPNFLDLPDETMMKILTKLRCDEISKLREVCHRFDIVCSNTLFREFQLLEVRLLRFLTEGRITLLEFKRNISEDELKRYDMLDKIDSVLYKILIYIQDLKKTVVSFFEETGQVFFPGKVIDVAYNIICTLLHHMKNGNVHEEVPFYLKNGDFDISHFEKLINAATDYFNSSVKITRFNFRSSTVHQMQRI